MKKLLLVVTVAAMLSGIGFSQMMEGMQGMMGGQGGMMQQPMQPMMMQPYGYYYQPMMPMMMMPMMGGMMGMGGMGMMGMMMQDPETMKIIREHRRKCMRELMKKLAKRTPAVERMMHMMLMHPEAVREVLRKNPELKKKMKELLK